MAFLARFLRIVAYAFFSWNALVVLWLGLPSPSREYRNHPGRYERDTLQSGKPFIRVYDIDTAFPYPYDSPAISFIGGNSRRSFALSYRLEQMKNTTLLTLMDGLTIDLSPEYATSYPFTSQVRYTVAKAGDQDGVNPPWFSKADSTLLFWWIHRDTAKLSLRVRWMGARTVEIWPNVPHLEDGVTVQPVQPLIVLNFEATVENGPNRVVGLDEVIMPEGSESPSQTYALRVLILGIIAPTAVLAMATVAWLVPISQVILIFRFIFDVVVFLAKVLGFYCAFVAFLWVVRGRRPLDQDQFVSRFPGMGFLGGRGASSQRNTSKRMVWGASGPIEITDGDDRRIQRRLIRNVSDFFRSSAPLDDLLATFESTRHLTEPIVWGDRVQFRRSSSRLQIVSNSGSERQRKDYSEDGLYESGLIDLEKALPEKPEVVRMK